jgi:hypothetical protein
MKMKFLFIAVLIGTFSIPLMHMQIISIAFAQTSDKSFKGNEAPFILPPESDRTPKVPPSDAISIKDRPSIAVEDTDEEEEVEIDKDRLPPLTAREIQELPFDTINDPELREVKIIPNETSFSDPIKSIVEEIIKNETIISNNDDINSFNSSKIKNKFDDTQLEQIFIAQNLSQDSETSLEGNDTEIISNTTADQDDNDNILSETNLPNREILNFINNTKVGYNTTEAVEQPAISDDLSRQGNITEAEGNITEAVEQPAISDDLSRQGNITEAEGNITEAEGNITEAEGNITEAVEQPAISDDLSRQGNITNNKQQNNEGEPLQEGKTITIEEIPSNSADSHEEEATEGNVTEAVEQPAISDTIEEPDMTTSSELQDEDQQQQQPLEGATGLQDEDQQQQQPLEGATGLQDEDQQQQQPLEGATDQITKNESKMKISEICNDEMDNDQDGIIDEEHECISLSSDTTETSGKIIPELATLDDNEKEEEDEKNIKDEKNSGKGEKVNDDSKKSKNKNNKIIAEEQTSINPESRPSGVEILTTEEICNDEMDNDLDGSIDEKKDCINK